MNIDKYLYEIIDSYKHASSIEEKNDIFNSFCSSIWSSKNKRRVYTKSIKFKVRSDLLESEIGQIFNTWSIVEYTGYKAMTSDTDWCSLIRQKINNLYTRYFDEEVILNKDYMNMLRTPKRLYYRWINGEEMNADELTTIIDDAVYNAKKLKAVYQKQKMTLSWSEYKTVIEEFLLKIFNNCKLIEDYETNSKLLNIYDLSNEDNFYISYICKSVDGEMLKWQKKYYEIRDHKKYKRCEECGKMIEIKSKKDYSTKYCKDCRDKIIRKQTNERVKKYRSKKCNAS